MNPTPAPAARPLACAPWDPEPLWPGGCGPAFCAQSTVSGAVLPPGSGACTRQERAGAAHTRLLAEALAPRDLGALGWLWGVPSGAPACHALG